MMAEAGLVDIRIERHDGAIDAMLSPDDPLQARLLAQLPAGTRPSDFVTSALFTARKPG